MTQSKGVYRKSPDDPKVCRDCKRRLSPSAFYGSGFHLSSECKECRRRNAPEEHRLWRKKKSEKARETERRHEARRKRAAKLRTAAARRERTRRSLEILNEFYAAGFTRLRLQEMGISIDNQSAWLRGVRHPNEASFKKLRLLWRDWHESVALRESGGDPPLAEREEES